MARHKLTDTQVRAAGPGRYGDGDGLWLYVSAKGTRSWVFIFIRNGRRREMGLGPYGRGTGQVTLAAAREKADAVREILGRGGDPFAELPERQAKVKPRTFGEVADELIEVKAPSFRNPKHLEQWRMTLAVYAKPLRKIPIAEVTTDDVVRVLRPLWRVKNETASRLRGRIEKALDYGKALGLRDGENPARWKGHLDHVLGGRQKLARGHHKAMPYADLPVFMQALRATEGHAPRALEFTILTAARTGETIGARWSEIDMDAATWTVPAERMKAGKEHVVPLSPRALEIVKAMHAVRQSEWLFPGRVPKKPLSQMALTMTMRRLGAEDFTVHGFRSAFRDWCGDATSFPRDVAEMALAHKVGDEVEQAYRRGSALSKRRKLMDAWDRYCGTVKGGDNVVRMAAAH